MTLNPDAIEGMAEAVAGIYSDAEQQIIAKIARQLAKGLGTPEWAAQQLLAVNRIAESARGDLYALLPEVRATLEAYVGQAAAVGEAAAAVDLAADVAHTANTASLATAMSAAPVVSQTAVTALAAEAAGLLVDANQAILRNVADDYRRIVSEVAGRTVTGSSTGREILQQSLNKFADRGITSFTDRSGRNWRIDSYAEMATRTATMRALQTGHTQKLQAAGRDLVVVSAHANSAPQCAPYQGKILSLSGRTSGEVTDESRLTGRPVTVRVFASMAEAESRGLHHPNCGHRHTLYVPGAPRPTVPPYDPEKYDNGQKLRYHERQVRGAKRRVAAAQAYADETGDTAWLQKENALLRARQARLRDHVAATGTPRRRYREQLRIGRPGTGDNPVTLTRRPPPDPTPAGAPTTPGPTPTPRGSTAEPGPFDHIDDLDELAAEAEKAIEAGDFDLLDALDAREAAVREAAEKRAARNAAAREKRAAAAEQKRIAQEAEYDRLVASGVGYEEAWQRAFDLDADEMRRQDAIATLRGQGFSGAGFDEVTRNAYNEVVHNEWLQAENTLTFLVRKEYSAKVDPRELWKVNENTARKWATPELLEWWDIHGRTTLDGYREQMLGGVQALAKGGDFYQ